MTDTKHTDSVEAIVERAVKSVTRDDDGLLDIGKHDHELLADLIREALQATLSQQVEEAVRKERERILSLPQYDYDGWLNKCIMVKDIQALTPNHQE